MVNWASILGEPGSLTFTTKLFPLMKPFMNRRSPSGMKCSEWWALATMPIGTVEISEPYSSDEGSASHTEKKSVCSRSASRAQT